MSNIVPIIIIVLFVLGAILILIEKVSASSAKKNLSHQGFQVDRYFQGMGGCYVALDLKAHKIALKGGKAGTGIHSLDQVQSAAPFDAPNLPTDSIQFVVMPRMGTFCEYSVSLKDTHEQKECIETLRGLGIEPPDSMDIRYV